MDDNAELVAELVRAGIARHEARWLVQEFVPGGDLEALDALRAASERRLAGEPLQYIIGHWPFRSLDLDVDSRVLIPRPETEELVGHAMRELADLDVVTPTILDLGCGSGAIGLALLDELRTRGVMATLVAIDASPDALEVARANARKHRLQRVSFLHSSWFDALDDSLRGRIDVIVANPPYVGAGEFEQLDAVLRHEPRSALVALDLDATAGFFDVAHIIASSLTWLNEQGRLLVEHSHLHRDAALAAARGAGFSSAEDLDDLAGHPRFLVARR